MSSSRRCPAMGCRRAMTAVPTSRSVAGCSSTCWRGARRPTWCRVLEQLAVDLVVYEQYDLGAAVAAHAVGIPVVCHSLSPRMPAERDRADRPPADSPGCGPSTASTRRRWTSSPATRTSTSSRRCCSSRRSSPIRHACRCARSRSPSLAPSCRPGSVTRTGHSCTSRSAPSSPPTRCWRRSSTAWRRSTRTSSWRSGRPTVRRSARSRRNVHVEPFVNQPAVLDLADLAVHHGGSGTLLAALASGIPQLLLPKGADQFFNADVVERAGLAPVLEPAQVTPDSVAAARGGRHAPAPPDSRCGAPGDGRDARPARGARASRHPIRSRSERSDRRGLSRARSDGRPLAQPDLASRYWSRSWAASSTALWRHSDARYTQAIRPMRWTRRRSP